MQRLAASAALAAVVALEEEEEQGKVNLLPIALDASRPMRADCGSCHSDAAAAHSGDSGCTRDRRMTALCAILQHATTGSLLPVASYSDRMSMHLPAADAAGDYPECSICNNTEHRYRAVIVVGV